MAGKKKTIVRVLILIAALLLVLVAAMMIWVRLEPLAVYERASRRALGKLGLERAEIELPTGKLVYWRGGEGPQLVLLHGAGHQAGTWASVAGDLMGSYELLIPDLPGHGESDPAAGPILMRDLYGGIEAFLQREAGETPPIVVGNSLGAWLGMIYSHRHPEGLARLVALNGGGLTNDPGDLTLLPANREEARKIIEAIRDPSSPKIPDYVLDDLVERSTDGPLARFMPDLAGMAEHALDGKLEEITTPVDLVWGESDRFMTLDYANRMLAQFPRARLTVVPECGHIPHNECPERLLETLEHVLSSEVPPPPPASEPGADEEPLAEARGKE